MRGGGGSARATGGGSTSDGLSLAESSAASPVRLSAGGDFAEVVITYTVTMGARHPAAATCSVPGPANWDGPALAGAREAHAAALAAAVRHAAAEAALRVVQAETAATRYRLRAVRDRWIPRLHEALAQVEFSLEEQERADGARLRQALRRPRGG